MLIPIFHVTLCHILEDCFQHALLNSSKWIKRIKVGWLKFPIGYSYWFHILLHSLCLLL
jgi:hypothetical protein